ncbi:MAG: penicillin-binding protein 2 [Rhodobacteraceae bacterium]|nr:MAG: penicillin-binding protein 2 [Paracoccaceae bacterium]
MKDKEFDPAISARSMVRRGVLIFALQGIFVVGLAARMRFLQIDQADQYRLLAEENRINVRLVPPSRGLVYDRDGLLIASNVQNYRAVIIREDVENLESLLNNLQTLLKISDEKKQAIRKLVLKHSPFVPITVLNNLSWSNVAKISVNAPVLHGLTADVGLNRHYPRGADYAHLLGYVGPVSDFDLKKRDDNDPLLKIPRFQIGKTGVEAKLEKALRGNAGTKRIEVNAKGRVIRELSRQESSPGQSVQMTIDTGLQNFALARLGKKSASAVVMRVDNGDLLSMASSPSFDTNLFVEGISTNDYAALRDNEFRPLADKSVQGIYPPGSTFKMVIALAALDEGLIKPNEKIRCDGHIELADRKFHCWKRLGHEEITLTEALEQSCDVFFYDLALRVGIEKITQMAKRLGIGIKHNLPLSGVARGLSPTKNWKLKTQGESWVLGDTLNVGIGQGYVLASPLQLAVMAARIASGKVVEPRIIKRVNGVEQKIPNQLKLDVGPNALGIIRSGMYEVSNGIKGTARKSKIAISEISMAAKTGTSQVRNITSKERATGVIPNEKLPYNRRDHALFVGFAPYNQPKYAIAVVVEHGGGGSKVAAPIARDIMLRALYEKIPPLEAYPEEQRAKIAKRLKNLKLNPVLKPNLNKGNA